MSAIVMDGTAAALIACTSAGPIGEAADGFVDR